MRDLQELMTLNDWDKAIMVKYPHVYDVKPTKRVYEAIDHLTDLFEEGTISWKGPRFFFTNEVDRTKFHNTWRLIVGRLKC